MGDNRRLEEVRVTYDRIADHFAQTRARPWPEVETFLDGVDGECGLDLGCANGRHIEPLAARCGRVVGVDASRRLLALASDRIDGLGVPAAVLQGDVAALPLATGCADVGVYVATIHHLGTRTLRRRSLDELARVLVSGGRALVSAWSVEHGRFDADEGFDTTVDWTLPDGEVVPRYYHVYDRDEFAADLAASALGVEELFVSSGNCYAECRAE